MNGSPLDNRSHANTVSGSTRRGITEARWFHGPIPLAPRQGYLFAVVATAATLGLRLALDGPMEGQPTLVMFTLPIMLSAYLGGLRAGLLATVLSFLAASYYLLPPLHSFAVAAPAERWQQFFIALAGVFISVLNEALHRARRRAGIATHERVQAETRLLPLQQSIAGMLEGIQIIDRDWRYAYVNAAAARHGRHSPADLMGRTMMECYPGIQATPLFRDIAAVMETRSPRQVQNEFTFAGGSMGWFELSIEPDPNGILIRSMDITAHKRAQDALIRAGVLQNAIFSSATFSCIATDAKGVIQIFNVGAERMLGYAAADVLNKATPADISDPQEVIARAAALSVELGTRITPGFEALVSKASRGIEDIYELTYIRKDGSRFPAIVSITALRDEHGGIIGYLLIGTDNRARKQIEEAQRENQALLRSIHLHAIVSVTDRRGCIVDVNESFCKISGYSREELLGHTHSVVSSGVQDRVFWTQMWRTIASGQPWRGEICNRAKDGSLYWVDSIISPFMGEDGQAKRYMSIRMDITARKCAEEALLKAAALHSAAQAARGAELDRKNSEMEQLVYTVSHDLKSPLVTILGFASHVGSDLAAGEPLKVLEDTDRIIRAANRLKGHIDELLELGRIGRVAQKPEVVDLDTALDQAVDDCQSAAKDLHVTIVRRLDVPTIVADKHRLHQVFQNLLSNAIKHGCSNPAPRIEVGSIAHGQEVRLFIRDNGPGIAVEHQDRIFGLFQHLGTRSDSSGVGLTHVRRIAEVHGGRAWVESTPGAGATFWVSISQPHVDPATSQPQVEAIAS